MVTNNTSLNLESPLVSIIILSRNDTEHHRACIDSILCQAYNNIELFFCDDGTPNFNASDILMYIKKTQSNNIKSVKVTHNETAIGISLNYKKAIEMSKGKYILTLSPDKVLEDSEVIEDIVKFFVKADCKIFAGYSNLYDIELTEYKMRVPDVKKTAEIKDLEAINLYKALCKEDLFSGLCVPVTRELINELGEIQGEYDVNFEYARNLKALREGNKIHIYSRPLVKDRMRKDDTIENFSNLYKKDMNTAIKNEIIPYKSKVGLVLYLSKKFELSSKYSV